MTSQEPSILPQDFFATEVRLFQADVDLVLRSGICTPVGTRVCLPGIDEQLPAELNLLRMPTLPLSGGLT